MSRINHKFKVIPTEKRFQFLQSRIKNTLSDRALPGTWALSDMEKRKRGNPLALTVDEHTKCYVCREVATVRHHVVPVSHGGSNKKNNLVPLCHSCHQKLHAPFRLKEPEKRSAIGTMGR